MPVWEVKKLRIAAGKAQAKVFRDQMRDVTEALRTRLLLLKPWVPIDKHVPKDRPLYLIDERGYQIYGRYNSNNKQYEDKSGRLIHPISYKVLAK